MTVSKVIISIIILLIMPELLGLLITKFTNEKNNIFFSLVVGYIIEFATFELIYIPMYFLEVSFKSLEYTWIIFISLCSIFSFFINIKELKNILNIKKILKYFSITTIVFILLLSLQIYVPIKYRQIVDQDDAFYVALSTTTIEENSLFKINPYVGYEYSDRQWRYCFAGLAIYYSVISETIGIHTAIFQHSIWPAVAIILEFLVYALIGNQLFNRNKEKMMYFLIFLSIIYIYGFLSIFTNFSFFAYRSWQGKALIANLIIPAIWLFYMKCMENEKKFIYWLMLFFLMVSACFVTEIGIFLAPISVGCLSFLYLFQNKKWTLLIKSLICCIPQIVIGIVYIFLGV